MEVRPCCAIPPSATIDTSAASRRGEISSCPSPFCAKPICRQMRRSDDGLNSGLGTASQRSRGRQFRLLYARGPQACMTLSLYSACKKRKERKESSTLTLTVVPRIRDIHKREW